MNNIKSLVLLIVSCVSLISLSACSLAEDDKGRCTIFRSGENLVIENVTNDECGETFLETPGARGYEWDPSK